MRTPTEDHRVEDWILRLEEFQCWSESLAHALRTTQAAVLAAVVLEREPEATHVVLEAGDPLEPTLWVSGDGRRRRFQRSEGWPVVLHPTNVGRPSALRKDGAGAWVLDLEHALRAERALPPMVEVLAVRDPDGPVGITAAVMGSVISSVVAHQVDAGAGWTYRDWLEEQQRAEACASRAMRPLVRAAFVDPPGAEYLRAE